MPISGAIFDFDGTLVDSMPAWHDVTVRMLERYGVPNAEQFFVETESLPLRELCSTTVTSPPSRPTTSRPRSRPTCARPT